MTQHRRDGDETRERLLMAASRLFASQGYAATTVGAICEAAAANRSSIKYYFGGKKALYVEAWRTAFERSIALHPPGGGVPEDAPPVERLGGHIYSILSRLADPESLEFDIADKEMAHPTGLLQEVMSSCITPLRGRIKSIIRELTGPGVDDLTVELCVMSVKAQVFGPLRRERHIRMQGVRGMPSHLPEVDLLTLTNHILTFSLAGIEAVRSGRTIHALEGVPS